ncbi:ATP-grasp domain-containing protein [Nannocystis pusilla]|uniref:ATP-grasp domain-containing protein n=1 Tax=Nannocystis pusilla TaxID=889268 RepID=UPI003B76AA8D
MRVAIATCLHKPEPDPDEALLVAALADAGVEVRVLAWDDPDAAWHEASLCVLRSTWNYPYHPDEFLGWARRVAAVTRMYNPLPVLEDNYHKSYLARLAARGVAVVDTVHLARGQAPDLAALLDERGWDRAVVKPAISAASMGTWRVERTAAAASQSRFTEDVALRDTMVQPYMRAVEEPGERALIWIDGALSHAIRKTARFAGEHERVSAALPIADDERELAETALAPLAESLLYARVDVVRDDAGAPRVMELELIEPSLYLAEHPPALARLVAAIVARLRE